jgi:hypothetical protein
LKVRATISYNMSGKKQRGVRVVYSSKCASLSEFYYIFEANLKSEVARDASDALLWFVDDNCVTPPVTSVSHHQLSSFRYLFRQCRGSIRTMVNLKVSAYPCTSLPETNEGSCHLSSVSRNFDHIPTIFACFPPRSLELTNPSHPFSTQAHLCKRFYWGIKVFATSPSFSQLSNQV